jgi:hypothetical protein
MTLSSSAFDLAESANEIADGASVYFPQSRINI